MKIILYGYIKVPLDELETIKIHLDEHIQNTLNEDGCLEFIVEQVEVHECLFNVYEKFKGGDAFNSHKERVKNSHWGSITKNVKRVYKKYTTNN